MNTEYNGPVSYQTVDAVIKNRNNNTFLVGCRKTGKWRFIGGFVDVKDTCLEHTVKRELQEETGINAEYYVNRYLFSFRVDDPRYIESKHKIMTSVFFVEHLWGLPVPGDDIVGLQWFSGKNIIDYYTSVIVEEHWPIITNNSVKEILLN